jgi:hypothetical protein
MRSASVAPYRVGGTPPCGGRFSFSVKEISNGKGDAPITTFLIAIGAIWKSVAGQLLASVVLFLSGHQDLRWRIRMGGSFWFFMAIAFGISALFTAIQAKLSYAAVICAVVLCSETLLILRWILRSRSNSNSK